MSDGEQYRSAEWVAAAALTTVVGLVIALLVVEEVQSNDAPLGAWVVLMATLLTVSALVGQARNRRVLGLLIDSRNKFSLSQLQIILWTVLIAAGLGAAALTNVAHSFDAPLDIKLHEDLLLLMGISTASFAGSALVKTGKLERRQLEVKSDRRGAGLVDLISSETAGDSARADISKVQMLFFTIIVLFIYGAALGGELVDVSTKIVALPEIGDGIAILLAISHAGYLTFKQAQSRAAVAAPSTAAAAAAAAEELDDDQSPEHSLGRTAR